MRNVKMLVAVAALAGVVLSSGCATNRGIVDVTVPSVVNPAGGKLVTITKVTDLRAFELRPSQANIPSLKDGQIDNPAITSRAIARKRNGYGKAMGDILLPEGKTVEGLVHQSVARALREKGYAVADGASGGMQGIPVEVEINKFWSWFSPGFWAVKLQFEAEVTMKSPIMLNGSAETVKGHVLLHSQAATGRAWLNTMNKGLEDLNTNIKAQTKNP